MSGLTDEQREALKAFCDTVVPAIDKPDDGAGFWGRTASDVGAHSLVEGYLASLPDDQQVGIAQLLDAFALQGITQAPTQLSREQILFNTALASPLAAAGVGAIRGLVAFLTYGAPDFTTGQNPNWQQFNYPGPQGPPPEVEKPIEPLVPEQDLTIDADICVIGSGAGGGVIAGTLAEAGAKVVVLEAGGYFNESDFNQLELWAYLNMYWRGGPNLTADGNVSLLAGATFGGGTTVNWTNCLRTTDWVRKEWAEVHGLEDVAGPSYDAHLDAVLARISANDQCSDFNGPHRALERASNELGYSIHRCVRNSDPEKYDPVSAGYMGFGDQSGAKQTTAMTYLLDAQRAGAQCIVRCRADRVLTRDGRAIGVSATFSDPMTGASANVTINAPQIVVAGGALETPALLHRSKIGGPAVGNYLRLHPVPAVNAYYDEEMEAWWGPPQAAVCDQFADLGDGHGFLVECPQYGPGIAAMSLPWRGGAQFKEDLSQLKYGATFIAVVREHGHGDTDFTKPEEPAILYSIDDERDRSMITRAFQTMARMHHAAGARQIGLLDPRASTWRRGEDFEAFIASLEHVTIGAAGQRMFSAHQMGSARMGNDPATSVANPSGELHDTAGVWVGDASAFPSASGTNPMITVMALARRTAFAIAEKTGLQIDETSVAA